MAPYETMQGPNEFLYIGNLKDWNRIPDLPRLTLPVLITTGEHDELTLSLCAQDEACAAECRAQGICQCQPYAVL